MNGYSKANKQNLNLFWQEIDEVSGWTLKLRLVDLNMNYISGFTTMGWISSFPLRVSFLLLVTGTFSGCHATGDWQQESVR